MKKIALLAAVCVLTPVLTNAQSGWWWWGPPPSHHHISGDEMAVAGFGLAALLAAVGYLVLRRRENS